MIYAAKVNVGNGEIENYLVVADSMDEAVKSIETVDGGVCPIVVKIGLFTEDLLVSTIGKIAVIYDIE